MAYPRRRGLALLLLGFLGLLVPAFVGPTLGVATRTVRVARHAEQVKRDDGAALGAVGIGASLVMGWSEWTLKTTGWSNRDFFHLFVFGF